MPSSRLDFSRRAQPQELPELMDGPSARDELRTCLRDLARVNRWLFGYRPTLRWLASLRLERCAGPIRILDVGCGYGDMLRQIERWAARRRIAVQLTGLDSNPGCVAIAAQATRPGSRMHWVAGDVFSYRPPAIPHLVISSLFTHHLSNSDVVLFLRWMEQNAARGWLVNDLSRASTPYHLFGWLARVFRLHPFVQHDGPVSIARAFQSADWRSLCAAAGLSEDDVCIVPWMPARLCVSRSKP